jgi:hypothetical protein
VSAQHAGRSGPASTIGAADPTPRIARECLFAAALLKSGCQVTAEDAPTVFELAGLAAETARAHPRRQAGAFDYAGHRFTLDVKRDRAGELHRLEVRNRRGALVLVADAAGPTFGLLLKEG